MDPYGACYKQAIQERTQLMGKNTAYLDGKGLVKMSAVKAYEAQQKQSHSLLYPEVNCATAQELIEQINAIEQQENLGGNKFWCMICRKCSFSLILSNTS